MPSTKKCDGFGGDGGISVGELVQGSVNASWTSGYWGINITFGIGGGIAPIDLSEHATYTWLEDYDDIQEKASHKELMDDAKRHIEKTINELEKKGKELIKKMIMIKKN